MTADPPVPSAIPIRGLAFPVTLRDREGGMFTVRKLRDGDRALLDAFYDAFEPKRAAQGLPPQGTARVQRWLGDVLSGGDHLIVEVDGRLVGHAMLMPTGKEGVREYAIFLDQSVRGRGMGTQVNRVSAELARTLDLQRLWLSVEPHNRAAVRSYQKAGYRFRPHTLYSPEFEMELDLSPGTEAAA
ncbi:GNAT family N-acetyltransferase [Longimicrobium sp.]|uniref:GNAT family N-acetyltransferase n=1 Tax=Longimicrobium sp. TaxID=2029185 RepID=UPI003B3BB8D5